MKKNKKREIASDKYKAENRRATIAESITWIKYSIECGFYLEATVVLESLIADRLESRLSNLKNENIGFQNLGYLMDQVVMLETNMNEVYSVQLVESIKGNNPKLNGTNLRDWTTKRNSVIHQMAKIEENNFIPFVEKKLLAKSVAEDGLKLFREISRITNNLRIKNLKKNNR